VRSPRLGLPPGKKPSHWGGLNAYQCRPTGSGARRVSTLWTLCLAKPGERTQPLLLPECLSVGTVTDRGTPRQGRCGGCPDRKDAAAQDEGGEITARKSLGRPRHGGRTEPYATLPGTPSTPYSAQNHPGVIIAPRLRPRLDVTNPRGQGWLTATRGESESKLAHDAHVHAGVHVWVLKIARKLSPKNPATGPFPMPISVSGEERG
jgi:hypothetical protein